MNQSIRHFCLTATAACGLLLSSASAQTTATTDPVGAMTVTVPSNSDAFIGIPFIRSTAFDGNVQSVSNNIVTVEGSILSQLSNDPAFLLFKSGSLTGQWFSITSFTADTIVVAEDLQSLGASVGDSFSINYFWTLGDFFDGGSGFPVSSNILSPQGSVSFKDLTSPGINRPISVEYIYYDGSAGGTAGWYDNNNLGSGLKDDTVISPETYMIIRNSSDSEVEIDLLGTVLTENFGMLVAANSSGFQDNYLVNPFPVPLSLSASGLSNTVVRPSPNILAPVDRLFLYNPVGIGINRSISAEYFYYDGSMGGSAGWYDANDLGSGPQGEVEIPAASGFIVRKSASTSNVEHWIPSPPY